MQNFINLFKEGMEVEARYVNLKLLKQYLDEDVLDSDRKYRKAESKRLEGIAERKASIEKRLRSPSAEINNPAKKAKLCETVSFRCAMRVTISPLNRFRRFRCNRNF